MKFFALLIITLYTLPGQLLFSQTESAPENGSIELIKDWMTGSFNSAEQEAKDSAYYNISLQMYPVWEDHPGQWIYVEQSLNSMQDKPYRQRIYELQQISPDTIASIVYLLAHPEKYIGSWKEGDIFTVTNPTDLILKEGCTVYLTWQEGIFQGSTRQKECVSQLNGASYATSIVTIREDGIESWDRGFNEEDEQVWGARKGPYLFKKLTH